MSNQQDILIEEDEEWLAARMRLCPPLPEPLILEGPPWHEPETSWEFPEVAQSQALSEQPKPSTNSEPSPHLGPKTSEMTPLGPYTPTLILHGGSGSITRPNLPPALYKQYRASLLRYLESTHEKLKSSSSALDAACHAVSLMEDDPLFNCGRGSVFTEKGTIEMEASVMVSSVRREGDEDSVCSGAGVPTKRGASVSLIKGTRHPVFLAQEVLLDGGDGLGGVGTMHCQLSGQDVEEWGWKEKGLERKGAEWFWTRKRWREHLRDLEKQKTKERSTPAGNQPAAFEDGSDEKRIALNLYPQLPVWAFEDADDLDNPSQGTVGAVCMDSWGNLAVATSTGGLTNKKTGRIGDTPTVGAGFWAESWDEVNEDQAEEMPKSRRRQFAGRRVTLSERLLRAVDAGFGDILKDCLPTLPNPARDPREILSPPNYRTEHVPLIEKEQPIRLPKMTLPDPTHNESHKDLLPRRRAVALGGTGNGDSFLRTAAARTAAAMSRFGSQSLTPVTLARAVTFVAGPGGEIQQSAGDRWQKTFEGQGGIIGIELHEDEKKGKVVFDFNCGGLWRAWFDERTGKPRVMVFKGEYEE
jgi:L-asparaginase